MLLMLPFWGDSFFHFLNILPIVSSIWSRDHRWITFSGSGLPRARRSAFQPSITLWFLPTLCLSFIFLLLTKFSLLSPLCQFVSPVFKASLMTSSCRVSWNQEKKNTSTGMLDSEPYHSHKGQNRVNCAYWNHIMAYIIFLLITESWFCPYFISFSSSLPSLSIVMSLLFIYLFVYLVIYLEQVRGHVSSD